MKNIFNKLRFLLLSVGLVATAQIQSSGIVPTIASQVASSAGLGQLSSVASQLTQNAQAAISAMASTKASGSAVAVSAGGGIHHPFVGTMAAIMSTQAAVAATTASLAGTALPVGICVAYAGTIAHAAHQAKRGQIKLTHTPENIYQLAALHEETLMLGEGSENGGNSDHGNSKTGDNNSWYKNTKFKIAAPSLGASIVAGMMKYFNQPEKQEPNSVEQLLDYLYEPTSEKLGKDTNKYWHDTRNYTEFNDGTSSLARVAGKGDKDAVVKATYDYYDRKNRSAQPDTFEFMIWHNTCDQEMYDKLQARKNGKKVDLELPLKAFCDIAVCAGKKEHQVPNIETHRRANDEEKNFTVDAGKFGTYTCRPGHLGLSNVRCHSEKEWNDIIRYVKQSEIKNAEREAEKVQDEAAKK